MEKIKLGADAVKGKAKKSADEVVKTSSGWIKRHKVFCIIALAAVVLLAGSITTTILCYRDKAAPGTTIAGVSVGGQNAAQLKSTVKQLEARMKLNVSYEGKTITANYENLGIAVDETATANAALKTGNQNLFALLFARKKIGLVAKYDAAALHDFISRSFDELTADPVNAQIVFSAADNRFVVQPGATGKAIIVGDLDDAARVLIATPTARNLTLRVDAAPPAVDDGGAAKSAEAANARLALNLRILLGGRVFWTIDPSDVAEWTTFAPNADSNRYIVSYDQAKVADFLNNQVAAQISGKPVNQLAITDADGHIFQVVRPGQNGQAPNNVNQIAGQIVAALNGGISEDFTLTTDESSFSTDKFVAADGHWAEVNLSKQTAAIWNGAQAVQTFVISSGVSLAPTPPGVFRVWYKTPSQTMKGGGDAPGLPAYNLPNVQWVSYFNDGIAFHGKYWNNIYGTPSSHGCINMTNGDAHIVYDFVSIGTPVWVHY